MNITSISQVINEKSDGEIVMAVQAEIKAVYEHKPIKVGTPDATTVQNVVLRDSTGEIRCAFFGHSDLSEHKGKTFVFHSNKTTRGIVGLKAKDKKDFRDQSKINRELEVSKSATIQTVEAFKAAHGGVTNASGAQQSAAPASSVKQTAPRSSAPSGSGQSVSLEMLSNFWECCFNAATAKQKKLAFSGDIKQSMIASLFIQGMKENLHFKVELSTGVPTDSAPPADNTRQAEEEPPF